MAGQLLITQGHEVVLHGRTEERTTEALAAAPAAAAAVTGNLSCISETRSVADQVNKLGRPDAVIHNAGIGYREARRIETKDGLPHVFAINVIAPYILTALIERPKRLIYISSGLHNGVAPRLDDLMWTKRPWRGQEAYAESKLYDVLLAFAIARRWTDALSNALEPGWVPTRMGGPSATDDISKAHLTQAWLATSGDPLALSSGAYFYHQRLCEPNVVTHDECIQDQLMEACAQLSGVRLATR
jgi:NAD(P)-dependent dehydrogenase (short-subunit alcohol dehydrogenase family)